MPEPAIQTTALRKTFPGGVTAVNGLDMIVERGSVYAFLGRNASGKTTTLRLLMGLLQPDEGAARILGATMLDASSEERQRVAYVSQAQQLHNWMTLQELCTYVSHFYPRWSWDLADELSDRFAVPVDRQVGVLSGGQQRKVSVLLALAAQPEVLILDEPAAGLDPIARRELTDALVDSLTRGEGQTGQTVLFSTHIVSDVERLADHLGFIDRGRLIAAGSVDSFQRTMKRVQVIFAGDSVPYGFELEGALRSESEGPVFTAIVKVLSDTQLDFIKKEHKARVQTFPLSLEDIFVEVASAQQQPGMTV